MERDLNQRHRREPCMRLFGSLFAKSTEHDSFNWPSNRGGLIASPTSTRLAYKVHDRHGEHVEVNGKRLTSYSDVAGITFSPDSRHIAYAAKRHDNWFVVVDDVEHEPYDAISSSTPVF